MGIQTLTIKAVHTSIKLM